MKPEVVELKEKRDEQDMTDKVEKYLYWVVNFSMEAASVWAQHNLEEKDIPMFNKLVKIELDKKGYLLLDKTPKPSKLN
jgi:hypothetical protein